MASRKKRKTEHGVSDHDALLAALKDIRINNTSVKKSAATFNINRISLGRYLKKFNDQVPDLEKLNDEQLLKIVRKIASYTTPKLVRQLNNHISSS